MLKSIIEKIHDESKTILSARRAENIDKLVGMISYRRLMLYRFECTRREGLPSNINVKFLL